MLFDQPAGDLSFLVGNLRSIPACSQHRSWPTTDLRLPEYLLEIGAHSRQPYVVLVVVPMVYLLVVHDNDVRAVNSEQPVHVYE